MQESPEFLEQQIAQHTDMARSMLRQHGSIGTLYLFAFGKMLMPVPVQFEDDRDKDNVLAFARALTCAYWPQSVGFMAEAWSSANALAAGVRPSEAEDRVEVAMLSVSTPARSVQRAYRIRRSAAGADLDADESLGAGSWSGRFVEVYPSGQLTTETVMAARRQVAEILPEEIQARLAEFGSTPPTGAAN